MADFSLAFPLIAKNEGMVLTDTPGDRGGRTYAGISEIMHPNWPGWVVINNGDTGSAGLNALVENFYKTQFWDAVHGDDINSQRIANFTFDWYVNSGSPAIKHLQSEVGCVADGIIGPQTLAAVNAANEDSLMLNLIFVRVQFYKAVVANDPTQEKFLKGWISRANSFNV